MKTSRENIENELKELSPFLHRNRNKDITAPKISRNYFEKLPDQILHRIREEEALKPKPIKQESKLNLWIEKINSWIFSPTAYASFAVVLVAFVGLFVWNNFSEKNSTNIANLNSSEIHEYLAENTEDIDEDDLIASLGNNLNEETTISQEVLKTYIEENDITEEEEI